MLYPTEGDLTTEEEPIDGRSRSPGPAGGGGGGPYLTGDIGVDVDAGGDLCRCMRGLELGNLLPPALFPLDGTAPRTSRSPLSLSLSRSRSRSRSVKRVGLCGGSGLLGGDIADPSLSLLAALPADEGSDIGPPGPAAGVDGPAVGGPLRPGPTLENL